jgi:hypothetical protein
VYVKLFSSLYQGTLRGRSDEILVFTNLLAYADQYGIVDKHFKAIADETGLDQDRVQAAITALESPDPESRSPELDGARIVRIDEHRIWGWKIVNYGKYRAIRNEEDRREQNRLAQERWRSKQNKQNKPPSAQAEAEEEAKEGKSKPSVAAMPLPAWLNKETWTAYARTRTAKARSPASLKAALDKLDGFRRAGHDPNQIVAHSLANGWQGLFPPDQKRSGSTSLAERNRAAAAEFVARGAQPERAPDDK